MLLRVERNAVHCVYIAWIFADDLLDNQKKRTYFGSVNNFKNYNNRKYI